MSFLSIGDLAQNFQTRRATSSVKNELNTLSYELTSGRKQNLSEMASHDYASVVGVERELNSMSAFETVANEAANLTATMQAALGTIEALGQDISTTLIDAATMGNASNIDAASADAGSRFEAVLATLNTKSAGRYVFSGQAWDVPAMVDAPTILNALGAAVSGLTDAASVNATMDAWFDTPGGGYESVAYQGSTAVANSYQVAENQNVAVSTSALSTEIRDTVKAHAKAAMLQTGLLTSLPSERAIFADTAGRALLGQQSGLTLEQARLGAMEARIAQVTDTQSAKRSALELMHASIIEADPFETATRLEAARGQLETIYTVTARLSQLSLANYLR